MEEHLTFLFWILCYSIVIFASWLIRKIYCVRRHKRNIYGRQCRYWDCPRFHTCPHNHFVGKHQYYEEVARVLAQEMMNYKNFHDVFYRGK